MDHRESRGSKMLYHHRRSRPAPASERVNPLGKLRYAHVWDVPKIKPLIGEAMAQTFRVFEDSDMIRILIEEAELAIIQMDSERNVVGFLAAKGHPCIPSVTPRAWQEYVWAKYKAVELNARNTLFIHLMCWNPVYQRELVDSMLRSVFMCDSYLHHIVMVKTNPKYPNLVPGFSRVESSFRRVMPLERERDVAPEKLPVLCIADRKEVCPRMKIRRAVEEDNDDIIPIIDRQSKRLRELYGDFYISELISRHPESDRVLLVMEHNEYARGVLLLNTEINYAALEECFDLAPFAGLRRNTDKHLLDSAEEVILATKSSSVAALGTYEDIVDRAIKSDKSDKSMSSAKNQTKSEKSQETSQEGENQTISTKSDDDTGEKCQANIDDRIPSEFEGEYNLAELALLSLLVPDDDEIDFDIINIDPEFLTRSSLLPVEENFPIPELRPRSKDISVQEDELKKLKAKKSNTTMSQPTFCNLMPAERVVRYHGEPNAFLIELFAIHPDYDERYGFDILEVAFELFPDREYCILCLPSHHTVFPLLEHFTLVASRNTKMKFANETLYVAHVNSIRGDLRVRLAEPCDLPHVRDIAEHVVKPDQVIELFQESLVISDRKSYLLLSEQQPVGLCILGPLEEAGSVRAQYTLEPEPRKPGTDAAITCGVLSPVFDAHARWFLREVLRLSGYNSLFYKQPSDVSLNAGKNKINICSLVEWMKPVKQRFVIPNITGYEKLDDIFRTTGPSFLLWIMERPLAYMPKVYINNSIVVIGASRATLSFLEELLLGPTSTYLTFSNLTLVSDNCLVLFTDLLRAATTSIPWRGRLTEKYLRTVPFSVYLDTISDVMVSIDRKNKCIHLKGGGVKFYDELVLAFGLQFQHPDYMKDALQRDSEFRAGKPCSRMLMDNPKYQPDRVPPLPDMPNNVFLINSLHQANNALRKLLNIISKKKTCLSEERPIIVYGECLEVYTCMAAVLELGVVPRHVAFVEPFPGTSPGDMRVNSFNDELVDGRVQMTLMEMGIRTIHEHKLMDWQVQDGYVTSLRLMGPLNVITIPCFALFYFGVKGININAFRAINSCGLVYDGGVVVSPLFETNDPHVRAIGTCCTYSRRLYAANELHRFYQSEEIGVALANIMLRKLNPFTLGDPSLSECPSDLFPRFSDSYLSSTFEEYDDPCVLGDCTNRTWQPVMKFKKPLTKYAKLPGPLYYFKMRCPGLEIPAVVTEYLPRQGHKLVTDKDGNYFSLTLDRLHCVVAMTCLSKKPFASEIFCQMFGKHEAFFNKMLAKYQLKQIDDFYEYFTQPWMSALYQEVFTEVLVNIQEDTMDEIYNKLKNSEGFDTTCESCKCSDLRKICGQSAENRALAAKLWEEHGGEGSTMRHLASYLTRHVDTNPHYAGTVDAGKVDRLKSI